MFKEFEIVLQFENTQARIVKARLPEENEENIK